MTSFQNNLDKEILKTIAYFDVFQYPLTTEQLFSYTPQNSASRSELTHAVNILVSEGRLSKEKEYFFLPTNTSSIVQQRLANEKRAKKMLSYAKMISLFIKRVPFVRGIFITGSLSKNVAASSGDIDYMIVCAPERLWICKTFLTVFRKIFLLGSSKYFCTNYYVTERGYNLNRKDFYTALEVVTTKVIWNESAFNQFQYCNAWTKEFLPNFDPCSEKELLISASRSFLQRCIEVILNFLPLRALDRRLMEFYRTHWQKVFKHMENERLNSRFVISPDISSNWPDDRKEPILVQYRQKLSSLGLR